MEPTQEQRFEQKVSNKTGEIARDRVPQRQAEIDRSYVLHSKRIYWICRRTQDVLLSAIALLVLWPFMLVIAGVIWLDSPGASPIFAQERIGRDGKPFMFLNLRHLDEELAKRFRADARYRERLSGVPGVRLNPIQPGVERNCAYFPVLFDGYKRTRNEVFERLLAHGIRARKYFYPATNAFACYDDDPHKTPVALHLSQCVLCLPMYAGLTEEEIDEICDILLG